jgi:hypothetical protein
LWRVTVFSAAAGYLLAVAYLSFAAPLGDGAATVLIGLNSLAGYAVVAGFWVGVAATVARALWWLCGAWCIVPLVLLPLALALAIWAGSGWVVSEGREAVDALAEAADRRGIEPIRGGLHGAPPLVLLLPAVIVHYARALVDQSFVWQFLQLVLVILLVALVGVLPASFVSAAVVLTALFTKFVSRFRKFAATEVRV